MNLNPCGCCNRLGDHESTEITNRPGLSAIAYRVGTHVGFKETVLDRLSRLGVLRDGLRTRSDDDFSIALADAFSVMSDVLTFYQERIANESYLRTATERRSLLELARLIGYELRPGVAAGSYLAFTVEDTPDAAAKVSIESGIKVQSIPGQGEMPQTFETVETIEARPQWNSIRARQTEPWIPKAGDKTGWFEGDVNVRKGDTLLFVRPVKFNVGKYWLWDMHVVVSVEQEREFNRTRVEWREDLSWRKGGDRWGDADAAFIDAALDDAICQVFLLKKKAAIFGHNSSNWRRLPKSAKLDYLGHEPEQWEIPEWPGFEIYAPRDHFGDLPPRKKAVIPTPKDVANAAKEAAENLAKSAEGATPAAILNAISKTLAVLKAFIDAGQALGSEFKTASTNAITATLQTYGPASTVLSDMFGAVLDIIRQFDISFPTVNMPQITPNDLKLVDVQMSWNVIVEDFGKPEDERRNPISFSGPNVGKLKDAIDAIVAGMSGIGLTIPSSGAVTTFLNTIGTNLTKLIADNPAFLPFNALKGFADGVLGGNANDPSTTLGKLQLVVTEALAAVSAARGIAKAMTGAAVTRAISDALVQTTKAALETKRPIPEPTPESVAVVARLTVKVAKYAALLCAIPGTTLQSGDSFLRKFADALKLQNESMFRENSDPFQAIESVFRNLENWDLMDDLKDSVRSTPIARDFDNMDEIDRVALAIVICAATFGLVAMSAAAATGIAIGAALIVGGGILAVAGAASSFLIFTGIGYAVFVASAISGVALAAVSVLFLAPGVLGGLLAVVAGAALAMAGAVAIEVALLGIVGAVNTAGALFALGIDLFNAARRVDDAVDQAVDRALHPPPIDIPPRLLPARDRTSIDLDATYSQVIEGGWLVMSAPDHRDLFLIERTEERSRAEFQMSSRVTRVKLRGGGLSGPFELQSADIDRLRTEGLLPEAADALETIAGREFPDAASFETALRGFSNDVFALIEPHERDLLVSASLNKFHSAVRDISIFAESQMLPLAEKPILLPVKGDVVVLDHTVRGLSAGRRIIFKDHVTAELAEIEYVDAADSTHTRLKLKSKLDHRFERTKMSINANVAHATHGETVADVLGSGDGGQRFQRFPLRHSPLTFVSASTPTGAATTLHEVRVNGVLWREVESFHESGPRDRVYIVRRDDAGKSWIQFGDGVNGSRVPTGQENVRAIYRYGIGSEGLLTAGQLSMLMTRPLGVRSVSNPLATNGAANSETLENARRNASLTLMALGRAVSLRDYEDFSYAFAGIAKASARWNWDGEKRCIFVTIAGPDGAEIPESSDVYSNLLEALRSSGDPYAPFVVRSFRKVFISVAASVKVDEMEIAGKVLDGVRAVLRNKFAFDNREFGQAVTLSEVVVAMHEVSGVVAVDVNALHRSEETAGLKHRLDASAEAISADGQLLGSELLVLDPLSPKLEVMA